MVTTDASKRFKVSVITKILLLRNCGKKKFKVHVKFSSETHWNLIQIPKGVPDSC